MKILLDENVHKKLKSHFPNYSVFTIREMDWQGKKNGELLTLMLREDFKALITGDKNMEYQQNFKEYPLPVIVLNTRFISYKYIKHLAPDIIEFLENDPAPGIAKIPAQ